MLENEVVPLSVSNLISNERGLQIERVTTENARCCVVEAVT